jgi:hypothetical protein
MALNTELLNTIFERHKTADSIKSILNAFNKDHANPSFKKGFYIYGSSGVGKTQFVIDILKSLNYDVIHYDAGDVRNKALIENITSNNISSCNVLDMMHRRIKKIAIVMDEIDGMNSGDKGGLTALIKLIRQKKTKKQKLESMTMNPIICIGNYNIDKKIKELMKVCNVFELSTPTNPQMTKLIDNFYPEMPIQKKHIVVNYANGDLRKFKFLQKLYESKPEMIDQMVLQNILNVKTFNEDTTKITTSLIQRPYSIDDHNVVLNETDRTTVALLFHENVIDVLPKDPRIAIPFYLRFLENICFADYIDRITFQNQIWHFNEMSSLMKTFNNNRIFHSIMDIPKEPLSTLNKEIRFTKVLTKYSTEYNNIEFIYDLCQKLDIDKKDLVPFFHELRVFYAAKKLDIVENTATLNMIDKMFEPYEINKLDVKRMYRYLDKNVKKIEADDLEEETI